MVPRVSAKLRRPAHSLPALRRLLVTAGSSHKVSLPFSAQSGSVHSVLDCEVDSSVRRPNPVAALPQPLCSALAVSTTSTIYSAPWRHLRVTIHSCLGFPRRHSWGWIHPSGSSRFARTSPLPALPSPPDLSSSGPAFAVAFACTEPVGLQGVARLARAEARTRIDRRRQRLVSLSPGLVPSWASLCGTAHPKVGPRHVFQVVKDRRDATPKSGAALTRRTLSTGLQPCNGRAHRSRTSGKNRWICSELCS